jgi:hypothetical protein
MRLAVTAVVAALLPALAVGHLEFFCASSVFSNHSQFCNKAIVWLGTCECGSTLTCNDAPTAPKHFPCRRCGCLATTSFQETGILALGSCASLVLADRSASY